MQITTSEIEYEHNGYRVQVEKDFKRNTVKIYLFDPNNNLINSFDSMEEVEGTIAALTEAVKSLKITG